MRRGAFCVGTGRRCIADLAAGWLNADDLCPACTLALMRALDTECGQPLLWHPNYLRRAMDPGGVARIEAHMENVTRAGEAMRAAFDGGPG